MDTCSVLDVVIVGAGLSGLSASRELLKHGCQRFVVVEASDRVGGRTFVDADGSDLGGAYFGPTQDRVASLVGELGFQFKKTNTSGKTVQLLRGIVSTFNGTIPPVSFFGLLDINRVIVNGEKLVASIVVENPADSPNAVQLDFTSCQQWIEQTCWTRDGRALLRCAIVTLLGCEPVQISLLFFLWYCRCSGGLKQLLETEKGAQDSKLVGGAGQIAQSLAATICDKLLLNQPIRQVDFSNKDEVITLRGGNRKTTFGEEKGFELRCKKVIFAVPPLQLLRMEFVAQPLPSMKMYALQHNCMGHYYKTFMYYSRPFWYEKGLSGFTVSDEGICLVSVDDSSGCEGCIMGFIAASMALYWRRKTVEERKTELCRYYAKCFDSEEALQPLRYKEKLWDDEPWIGGAPVALPTLGALTLYGRHSEPVEDRIFFAGTEAAKVHVGYMDGAVEAGERNARNALVALGVLPQEYFEKISRPTQTLLPSEGTLRTTWVEALLPSVPVAAGAIIGVVVLFFSFFVKNVLLPRKRK